MAKKHAFRRIQLNWGEHECKRCHQVKPGNGLLCDDCWYDGCDAIAAGKAWPYENTGLGPQGHQDAEVTPCPDALF